jgi:Flp pilus assembly protein TadD
MGRAEVLWLAGRDDEARNLLEQALARFDQKGNLVMADLARSLLANPSAR